MKTKALAATIAIVAAAAGASLLLVRTRPEAPQSARVEESEFSRIRADIERVRAERAVPPAPGVDDAKYAAILARLSEAERKLVALRRGHAESAPSRTQELDIEERAAAAQATRERLQQQQEAQTLALQNALESRLFDEALDPQWARQTQDAISRGLLDPAFSGNQLTDLKCQSSVCRMQVYSAHQKAHEQLIAGYSSIDAFANAQAFWKREDQPDGSSVTILYLMREGTPLPGIPNPG